MIGLRATTLQLTLFWNVSFLEREVVTSSIVKLYEV